MSDDVHTLQDKSVPATDAWPRTLRQLDEIRRLEQRVAELKRSLLHSGEPAGEPQTGTTTALLLVRLGHRLAAIPMDRVEEVVRMASLTPTDAAVDAVVGLADYHGSPVAVLDPRGLLGEPVPPVQASQALVFCALPHLKVSIRVDEVVDVAKVEKTAIVTTEEVLPGGLRSAGVARTAEGTALVLDPLLLAVTAEVEGLHTLQEETA